MSIEEQPELQTSVSFKMNLNLGNYSSAECFMSITNITKNTTKEELSQMTDQGHEALRVLYHRVKEDLEKIYQREKRT